MKFLKKVFILMFLSYSTLLSCNNDSSKSDEKENSKLINGRLIYKAIVFGFGDVANEINRVYEQDGKWRISGIYGSVYNTKQDALSVLRNILQKPNLQKALRSLQQFENLN